MMKDWYWWALGIVALAAVGYGGKKVYDMTRGLRNNNPGNIRHSGTQWHGMSATQTDPAFIQFIEPKWGIRALARTLQTYSTRYGLNTVRGIINRWAPPSENDTGSYVDAVARALGVSPDAQIDVFARAGDLTRAIIKHENGLQPYSLAELNAGLSLAGVPLLRA